MSRRRKHEDHVNHEAWAIPYGDLITLLLAFFVVMYALSSVNEGKYRILSDSLLAAFRSQPKSLEPIQVGQPSRNVGNVEVQLQRVLVPLEVDSFVAAGLERYRSTVSARHELALMRMAGLSPNEIDEATSLIEDLTSRISDELAELIDEDLIRLRQDRFWLEVEINTSLLFETASAGLTSVAADIVRRLGAILVGTHTHLQIEGHTDALPIRTELYPSNWELSSARAATVVRLFSDVGIDPAQLAAVGFGEYRPVADNDTVEGRRSNRRVTIVVMAGSDPYAARERMDPETDRLPLAPFEAARIHDLPVPGSS